MVSLTQPFTLLTSGSVTPYGTTPPTTLPNVTGAASPLGWVVSFFDDFTGTLAINNSAWTCTTGATYNGTPAVYTFSANIGTGWGGGAGYNPSNFAANMQMSNSIMRFILTNTNGSGRGLDTGAFVTDRFLQQKWGYWEANLKMPSGANGNQSGFWGGWWISAPAWPEEIDIIEQSTSDRMVAALHYAAGNIGTGLVYVTTPPANSIEGFHTYGCLVCPNYLAFYLDGVLIAKATKGVSGFTGLNGTVGQGPTATNPTIHNYGYDVLNGIIGFGAGSPLPQPTAAQLPATMQVDWIRYSILNDS